MYFTKYSLLLLSMLMMVSDLSWTMEISERKPDDRPLRTILNWTGLRNFFRKKDKALEIDPKADLEDKGGRPRQLRSRPIKKDILSRDKQHDDQFQKLHEEKGAPLDDFSGKLLAVEQYADYIKEKGIVVGTRESSPQKRAFLELVPDSFFRALYLLIRKSYEEKNSLDAVEFIKDQELLTHQPVKSHSDLLPQIENMHLHKTIFAPMEEEKELLSVLIRPLVAAIREKESYTIDRTLVLLFNMLGLHALTTDLHHEEKGRYVGDGQEQEVHKKLKGKMIKLIGINEDGSLTYRNFFTNCLEAGKYSPIASDLYQRLMRFLKECSSPQT